MEERYLSLAEACEVLGKSERTLYRWIKSGKLKAYKPGRDYEIPESAIREMRERSEVYPKDLEPRLFDPETTDLDSLDIEGLEALRETLAAEMSKPASEQRGRPVVTYVAVGVELALHWGVEADELADLKERVDALVATAAG